MSKTSAVHSVMITGNISLSLMKYYKKHPTITHSSHVQPVANWRQEAVIYIVIQMTPETAPV